MKKNAFILLFFVSFLISSQEISKLGVTLGYKKIKSSKNISVGISRSIYVTDSILLGGSIEGKYITNFKDNHIAVIGVNAMFLFASAGLNISNKYVEPNVGLDFIYGRLNIGYAINYISNNYFTYGLQVNIPVLELNTN